MKKAGSRTGARGLTLVETLLAVVILSSTIVFIVPAFFKSGAVLKHLAHRSEAELLMNNLIVQKEEDLRDHHGLDERTSRGQRVMNDTTFDYELETFSEDKSGFLYLVTVRVNWRDLKENQVSKSADILR